MAKKLSARERNRRLKQRTAQWEKNNPELTYAFKNFQCPEATIEGIQFCEAGIVEQKLFKGFKNG